MKLNRNFPKPVAPIVWISRIVCYGVSAVIISALIVVIGIKRYSAHTTEYDLEDPGRPFPDILQRRISDNKNRPALGNTQNMGEGRNRFAENTPMNSASETQQSSSANTPCMYVGIWKSYQPRCTYKILLEANGKFTAEPVSCTISSEIFSGSWRVYENKMIWIYDRIVSSPDVNLIESVGTNTFTLVEADGSRTIFTRLEAIRCSASDSTVPPEQYDKNAKPSAGPRK